MAADVMHVLHIPLDTLRRERWSAFVAWHVETVRIVKATRHLR